MHDELLIAAEWYCPAREEPSSMDLMDSKFNRLKKKQLALAKNLEHEVRKNKDLVKIKRFLYNIYKILCEK